MLVLLREDTWTSGERSEAFAAELTAFCNMEKEDHEREISLVLAHEAPGDDLFDGRKGAEFEQVANATPEELRHAGLYNLLALMLKGRAWRTASLVSLGQSLARHASKSDAQGEDKHRTWHNKILHNMAKTLSKDAVRPTRGFLPRKVVTAPQSKWARAWASSQADVDQFPYVSMSMDKKRYSLETSSDATVKPSALRRNATSAQIVLRYETDSAS